MITVAISAGQEVTPLDPPHCRSILAAYSSLHQVASSTLESGLAGGSVLETMDGPDVGDIGRLAPLSLSSSSSSASKTWGTIVGPTLIVFIHLTYSIVQWPYKPAKDVLILPGNGGDCWGLGVRGFLTSPRSGSLMRSALLESKNHGLCIQVSSTQKNRLHILPKSNRQSLFFVVSNPSNSVRALSSSCSATLGFEDGL